mgnify:CR=1 FL=1
MPIEKGLIGYQDISFGTGTFQRKSQSGQLITLNQFRASHVPVLDSAGRFTGTDIEAALAETMTREESGSTVKKLTNRSGAQREAGDVVIIDTSNDDSFTTTTTEGNVLVLGVVLETTENLATGRVATGGYVGSVKVTGATVRGDYLKTSTTVLKAVPTSSWIAGVFAVALSNNASVVSAYIFGCDKFGYTVGNATGNIPLANGTVCTDLNADKLDGQDAPTGTIVGTSDTQTLTNKTITGMVSTSTIKSGGSNVLSLGGNLNVQYTPISTSGTVETNLMSWTIPTSFGAAGKVVKITAGGFGPSNTNAKTVRFYIGGTAYLTASISTVEDDWKAEIFIVYDTSGAAHISMSVMFGDGGVAVWYHDLISGLFANGYVVKFTGQVATAGTLSQYYMVVQTFN